MFINGYWWWWWWWWWWILGIGVAGGGLQAIHLPHQPDVATIPRQDAQTSVASWRSQADLGDDTAEGRRNDWTFSDESFGRRKYRMEGQKMMTYWYAACVVVFFKVDADGFPYGFPFVLFSSWSLMVSGRRVASSAPLRSGIEGAADFLLQYAYSYIYMFYTFLYFYTV